MEIVDCDGVLHATVVADGRVRLRRLRAATTISTELAQLRFSLRRLAVGFGSSASLAAAADAVAFVQNGSTTFCLGPIPADIGDRPLRGGAHRDPARSPWSVLPSCAGRSVTVSPSPRCGYGQAPWTIARLRWRRSGGRAGPARCVERGRRPCSAVPGGAYVDRHALRVSSRLRRTRWSGPATSPPRVVSIRQPAVLVASTGGRPAHGLRPRVVEESATYARAVGVRLRIVGCAARRRADGTGGSGLPLGTRTLVASLFPVADSYSCVVPRFMPASDEGSCRPKPWLERRPAWPPTAPRGSLRRRHSHASAPDPAPSCASGNRLSVVGEQLRGLCLQTPTEPRAGWSQADNVRTRARSSTLQARQSCRFSRWLMARSGAPPSWA